MANQREHIILLLANADIRNRNNEEYDEVSIVVGLLSICLLRIFLLTLIVSNAVSFLQLKPSTVTELMDKTFENYCSWCKYLHLKPNLKYVIFFI